MGKCGQCGLFFKRLDSHQRTSTECGDPSGADEEESSVEESFLCDDLDEAMQEVNVGCEEIFTETGGHADRPNQRETIANATRRQNQSESLRNDECFAAPDDLTASRHQNMATEDVDDLIENFHAGVSIDAAADRRTQRRSCVDSSAVAPGEQETGRSGLQAGSALTSFPHADARAETLGVSETSGNRQPLDSLSRADSA